VKCERELENSITQ